MLPNVTHEPLKLCHSHFPFNELNCEQRHIDTNTCMHVMSCRTWIHALFMFVRIFVVPFCSSQYWSQWKGKQFAEMGTHSATPKCYRAMYVYIGHIYVITHLWQFPVAFRFAMPYTQISEKKFSTNTHTLTRSRHFSVGFFVGDEDWQNVIRAATATNKSIFYDSLIYTQHLEKKKGEKSVMNETVMAAVATKNYAKWHNEMVK